MESRSAESAAKPPTYKLLRLWGPLVLWLVIIFVFSSLHRTPLPKNKYISWDKVAHILEYSLLGYLAARALALSGFRHLRPHYLGITLLIGLLYGISDEIHQYYVPGRYSSPWDVLADLVGVTIGALVFRRWLIKNRISGEALLPMLPKITNNKT